MLKKKRIYFDRISLGILWRAGLRRLVRRLLPQRCAPASLRSFESKLALDPRERERERELSRCKKHRAFFLARERHTHHRARETRPCGCTTPLRVSNVARSQVPHSALVYSIYPHCANFSRKVLGEARAGEARTAAGERARLAAPEKRRHVQRLSQRARVAFSRRRRRRRRGTARRSDT